MARLIEVQQVEEGSSPLAIRVGDVLLIRATGARVRGGGRSVELWGPFLSAVVGETGAVLAPIGPPNAVLVRAREPGSASLDVFTGDPWHAPRTTTLDLTVE
jgi:hypothetical protein